LTQVIKESIQPLRGHVSFFSQPYPSFSQIKNRHIRSDMPVVIDDCFLGFIASLIGASWSHASFP
jgi:hypothetical protein